MTTDQGWTAPSNVAHRSYTLSNLLRDMSRNMPKKENNFSKVYLSSLHKTLRHTIIRKSTPGICGRVAVKKSLFRKGNRVKRLRYDQAHKDWNEEQWKRVVWSDTSNFWVQSSTICEKKSSRVMEEWVLAAFSEIWWMVCPGLGLHFCQWCWRYCPNWWDHEWWKVQTGFNSSCHSFWKASDWKLLYFCAQFRSQIIFREKNSW